MAQKIAVMGEDWKTRRGKREKEICRVGQVDAATIYALCGESESILRA
jgi:hypothetical protein